MSPHLVVLVSLGGAILLSPEITVLGLLVSSDRRTGRSAAAGFALGTAVGLATWIVIGFLVPMPQTSAREAPTWTGFTIHAAIAAALLAIGLVRAVNALRKAPIKGVPGEEPGKAGHDSWKGRVLARISGADAPPRRRIAMAFLLGLVAMGPHPKIFPIVIAATHQAQQLAGAERIVGLALFVGTALLPGLIPLGVELVRPGGSSILKESMEAFMKGKGRWMAALILIGAGIFVGSRAWENRPGAGPGGGNPVPAADAKP